MKNLKYFFALLILLTASQFLLAQDITASLDYIPPEKKSVSATETAEESVDSKFKVNISATLISRFIWRGLELGDHPHIQPEVTFSTGNFFFGAWASHGIAPVAYDESVSGYKEVIPYIGYNFKLGESGNLTLLALDHYNPNFGDIGNWKESGEGSNTLEARAIFKFGDFDLLGSVNFYNDPENSTYVELGYTANLPGNFNVRPLVSFTPTKSPFNGTEEFAFTQIGVIASKDIKVAENVTIPVKVDFIVNPEMDKFFTAFGLGVRF